ncbi:Nn.00g031620.m01.CDS01 [Neocucurbitaria sp. VM-36]
MHNSQAETRMHSRIIPGKDSAFVSAPTQEPTIPPPHEQRHQPAIPAELSGAGTWTVAGAEEASDTSALYASQLPSHGTTQYNSQAQRHLTRLSQVSSNGILDAKKLLSTPADLNSRRDSLFNASTPSIRCRGSFVSEPSSSVDSEASFENVQFETHTDVSSSLRPVIEVQDDSTAEGAEEVRADDINVNSEDTPNEISASAYGSWPDPNRPYTDSLGPPGQISTGGASPALSIISDAGHQQQLRQKQTASPSPHQCLQEYQEEDASDSSSTCPLAFELQEQIFHALVRNERKDAHIPSWGFLPQEQLYRVVNSNSVARKLSTDLSYRYTSEQIKTYASTVCNEPEVVRKGKKKLKSFQKIFAILVMVEMSSAICHFLDEDVSDIDLPLIPTWKHGRIVGLCRWDPSGVPSTPPLQCFRRALWSPVKLRNFEQEQWTMLAPFFSQGEDGEIKHYVLQDKHILPFLAAPDAEADKAQYGGFSKVTMVHIHPDHHNFKDNMLCERGFAIKQLYEKDREAFRREVNILKKFSGPHSHKHIVSLLATFEQRGKFHLMFYRAGGDLFKYWKELEPDPEFNYANALWMAKQCAGIADGLMKLHNHLTFTIREADMGEQDVQKPAGDRRAKVKIIDPILHVRSDSFQLNGVCVRPSSPTWNSQSQNTSARPVPRGLPLNAVLIEEERFGRHGDINPGNILWFHDSPISGETQKGTLKIADFGQAELNSAHSRTRPRDVANTMTYRPPECDIQPKIIRQSYDIWCLGCVYLEFVTWMLGGKQLLTQFGKRRVAHDRHLNSESDIFFEFIENSDTAGLEVRIKPAISKFIEKLHRHPKCTTYFHELLVMIQHDMLIVESKDRKSCMQVKQNLEDMYKRCEEDTEYVSMPMPWLNGSKLMSEPLSSSMKVEMTEEAELKIAENLHAFPLSRLQRRRTGLKEQHRGISAPEL